eukprot:TRINITY_DN4373_c0_g2_i2.p1 TRINITY_DN4373_c0_g2~~TRINITY_DN4373_c0_g2_i2.p1  ORF type:complete len:578 (+),score=76.67 TRINITY_DN4373_c0_g2_i2:48-1781(+)
MYWYKRYVFIGSLCALIEASKRVSDCVDRSEILGVDSYLTKQRSIMECLSKVEQAKFKDNSVAGHSTECENLNERIKALSPEEADKELNAIDDAGRTVLHWACGRRDSELALLIMQRPEFKSIDIVDAGAAETALMHCASQKLLDVTLKILERDEEGNMKMSRFQQNVNHRTVLHYAAAKGAHEIVNFLCIAGDYEFVSHPDINGFTALDYAMDCKGEKRKSKRVKDVMKLKRVQWDGTIMEGDVWHETMSGELGCKAESDGNPDHLDHNKTVDVLRRMLRIDDNLQVLQTAPTFDREDTSTEEGPILKCLMRKSDTECEAGLEEQIRGLSGIEAIKQLNEMGSSGRNPLHWALGRNLSKVALALIQHPQFISIDDPDKNVAETALFWAADMKMDDVAHEILESFASSHFALFQQNINQRTVLHYAAAKGMHEMVGLICSVVQLRFLHSFLSHKDIDGFTALDYAKDCDGKERSTVPKEMKVVRVQLNGDKIAVDQWHMDQYGDIGCKKESKQNHEETVRILEKYTHGCKLCSSPGEQPDDSDEPPDGSSESPDAAPGAPSGVFAIALSVFLALRLM